MRKRFWRVVDGRTTTWGAQQRLGRLQLRIVVHRHATAELGDRWVVQPCLVWDRRP